MLNKTLKMSEEIKEYPGDMPEKVENFIYEHI